MSPVFLCLDRQRTARPRPRARLMAKVTCTNTMRASFRALAPETLPFGWQPIFHSSCPPSDWLNCAQKPALKPTFINLTGPREFQGSAPLTPLRFPLSLICCTRQALQPLSGQARYPKVLPVTCTTSGSTSSTLFIPMMRTKAPSGNARTPYSTSPLVRLHTRGPKPIKN